MPRRRFGTLGLGLRAGCGLRLEVLIGKAVELDVGSCHGRRTETGGQKRIKFEVLEDALIGPCVLGNGANAEDTGAPSS